MENKITEDVELNLYDNKYLDTAQDVAVNKNSIPVSSSNGMEHDLSFIRNKRIELDNIHEDLDNLLGNLNSFLTDNMEMDNNTEQENNPALEGNEILNTAEKQDSFSEKELTILNEVGRIYKTDGTKPPEIDWDTVGPILQKHVNDLQRLHILNQMANAIVKRIRNITHVNELARKKICKEDGDS